MKVILKFLVTPGLGSDTQPVHRTCNHASSSSSGSTIRSCIRYTILHCSLFEDGSLALATRMEVNTARVGHDARNHYSRALPSFAAPSEPRRTTLKSLQQSFCLSKRVTLESHSRRLCASAQSSSSALAKAKEKADGVFCWSSCAMVRGAPAAPSIAPRAVGHQPATTPHSRPPPRQAARPRFRTTASHHLVYLPLRQRETAHVYERREGPSRREQLLQGSPLLILFAAVVRPSHPGRDHGKRRYRYFQEMARRPRARAT